MLKGLKLGLGIVVLITGAAAAENIELALSAPLTAKLIEDFCLHTQPSADADVVMCLMSGADLTLVARLKDKETFDGKEGYWYKAEAAGGATGWVFSTKMDICAADKSNCGSCPKK